MALVIPYVKQTWTDGSGGGTPVSAARLGVVEDGLNNISQAPAVHVYHNATQSITTSTETTVAFNSERFDQAAGAADTMHDTAVNNSRLTCRYAGVYDIAAMVDWATGAVTQLTIWIRKNGTDYLARDDRPGTGGTMAQSVGIKASLAVNDYVEVRCFHNAGVSRNIAASGTGTSQYNCEFMMVRVA